MVSNGISESPVGATASNRQAHQAKGRNRAYVLAVASHKGGTTRTTTAAALAWLWGQQGRRVALWDAEPLHSLRLLCASLADNSVWRNVAWLDTSAGTPAALAETHADLVIADCPSLTEPQCQAVLQHCDGVIVTCLADPLSLRSVPVAAAAIGRARRDQPSLTLLGLMISRFDSMDMLQAEMLRRLRLNHRQLLIEPPIPYCESLANWPSQPGADMPAGAARQAYGELLKTLTAMVAPPGGPSFQTPPPMKSSPPTRGAL